MTNEKTEFGTMEAFSFRKGVVKISGRWIRFGPEAESAIKALSKGDSVSYVQENGTLKNIQKQVKPVGATAAGATMPPAQAKTQGTSPVTSPVNSSFQDRNKSIERQVALKAAVELAGLYGYKTTKECLDVAASFANWIEAGNPGELQLPPNGHEGRTATQPSSS